MKVAVILDGSVVFWEGEATSFNDAIRKIDMEFFNSINFSLRDVRVGRYKAYIVPEKVDTDMLTNTEIINFSVEWEGLE